jgi:hypothetical protein
MFAIFLPVLALFFSWVVDGGHAFLEKRSAQNAADASALACGTPAFFWSAIGMKGLGRASSGHASSVSPLTHRQSKRRPADSSTPRIWIGAGGDSGWNSVSRQRCARRANAAPIGSALARRSSFASSPSISCHLARVWYSSESSARSPGKPAASRSAEKWRAQAAAVSFS